MWVFIWSYIVTLKVTPEHIFQGCTLGSIFINFIPLVPLAQSHNTIPIRQIAYYAHVVTERQNLPEVLKVPVGHCCTYSQIICTFRHSRVYLSDLPVHACKWTAPYIEAKVHSEHVNLLLDWLECLFTYIVIKVLQHYKTHISSICHIIVLYSNSSVIKILKNCFEKKMEAGRFYSSVFIWDSPIARYHSH